jgi:hypothetical protein
MTVGELRRWLDEVEDETLEVWGFDVGPSHEPFRVTRAYLEVGEGDGDQFVFAYGAAPPMSQLRKVVVLE